MCYPWLFLHHERCIFASRHVLLSQDILMAYECSNFLSSFDNTSIINFYITPKIQLKIPLEDIPIHSFSNIGAKKRRKKYFSWYSLRHMSCIGSVEWKQLLDTQFLYFSKQRNSWLYYFEITSKPQFFLKTQTFANWMKW